MRGAKTVRQPLNFSCFMVPALRGPNSSCGLRFAQAEVVVLAGGVPRSGDTSPFCLGAVLWRSSGLTCGLAGRGSGL